MVKASCSFPIVMKATAALSAAVTLLFACVYSFLRSGWLLSCAITFGTVCYHFSMRLLVGALVPARFDHRKRWFQVTDREAALYRRLKLKRWKNRMPTYDPNAFSLAHHAPQQIIRNMCQAEVVHEIIILCSFIPILGSLFFGAFPVFFVTSLLSACFDMTFVMLQRYNRPRLIHLVNTINKFPKESPL